MTLSTESNIWGKLQKQLMQFLEKLYKAMSQMNDL